MQTLPAKPATRSQGTETRAPIVSADDIVKARQHAREQAIALGFCGADVTLLAAAISEVARNIVDHAEVGEIVMRVIETGDRRGLQVIARDEGPGISDVPQAMSYGYSSRRGIGMGIPGAKWLMDEFDIASAVGSGTTVTMVKWLPHNFTAPHAA